MEDREIKQEINKNRISNFRELRNKLKKRAEVFRKIKNKIIIKTTTIKKLQTTTKPKETKVYLQSLC